MIPSKADDKPIPSQLYDAQARMLQRQRYDCCVYRSGCDIFCELSRICVDRLNGTLRQNCFEEVTETAK